MRFSSQYERLPVYGTEYAIATSHPTASAIGFAVLESGGNAVDAALAAHAALCVVEPGMTGIGGDCFALYYDAAKRKVIAINGSGYAPAGQSRTVAPAALQPGSAMSVTIPGAVDAWCQLSRDYGTRNLEELFAPAILLARDGAPVHARVAWDWANEAERLATDPVAREVFLNDGKAPAPGTIHAQPLLAVSLAAIAARGRSAFYEGEIAEDIVATLGSRGGAHTLDDMAGYSAHYCTPIETTFAGHRIVECPPNGQGVIALLLLNILGEAATALPPRSEVDWIHLVAEATKIAYGIRDNVLADERDLGESVAKLLDPARSRALAQSITSDAASLPPRPTSLLGGNTTYLCAFDRNGNCISFINSLYDAFGSCIVTPKTGVLLNNRGMCFSTTAGHPNCIGPGKRPMQTIIPGMILSASGDPVGPFGVMGGHYQATGHADFLRRVLVQGLDPQSAINAPRTFATEGVLRVEPTVPQDRRDALAARGHAIPEWQRPIGGAQAIILDQNSGVLVAGSDPRKDGCAVAV